MSRVTLGGPGGRPSRPERGRLSSPPLQRLASRTGTCPQPSGRLHPERRRVPLQLELDQSFGATGGCYDNAAVNVIADPLRLEHLDLAVLDRPGERSRRVLLPDR
jgi:hypothetical protein